MSRTKLLLFDIDGTLMMSGGAGARALARALREEFGLEDGLAGVRLGGQTDPQIVTDALERAGLAGSAGPERVDRVRDLYLTYLASEIQVAAQARVLPGVVALLTALSGHGHAKLALLTGNYEPGARIKLGRFDLNRYFTVGGFGSDSHVRRELVPIAMDRARAHFSEDFAPGDVVVIGDTEKDVDCGRHSGTRTVAVATGSISATVLKGCQPDLFFASFEDTARVSDLILSL